VIDNARPNFVLSHREIARIFSSAEQNWAKKKIPAHAAIFASPRQFFSMEISKRPEMSSHDAAFGRHGDLWCAREKSEKAKTMKEN